jgi:hypothetical protein
MTTINFAALGFTGPSFFDEAGPAQKLVIPILDNGNLITATIINGVVLGSESNLSVEDPEVYGTANFGDPSLLANIEIQFDRPVSNFSVTVFNGLTTPTTYTIIASTSTGTPNRIEAFTHVSLDSNSSDASAATVNANMPEGGAVDVLIVADSAETINTGNWDFSIDNINFDFSPAQIQIPKNPAVSIVNINLVKSLLFLSELGALVSPSELSTTFFTLQFKGLWGRQFSIDALVDPFDPNYKQSYVPTFVETPAIVPDKTVTQQAANDANTASSDSSKAVAYLQAMDVT